MKTYKRIDYSSKILFIVVVVILALFFLKALLAPVIFSGFISVLLLPLCDKLESWKVSRVLSIVLVLVTITLTILLLFYLFSAQINSFLNDFPNIESKIQKETEIVTFKNILRPLDCNIYTTFHIFASTHIYTMKYHCLNDYQTIQDTRLYKIRKCVWC